MEIIKIKPTSYIAKKSIDEIDNGIKYYDKDKEITKTQDVMFCQHCHQMDWLYKYYVLESGIVNDEIINKLKNNMDSYSYGDIVKRMAESYSINDILFYNLNVLNIDEIEELQKIKYKKEYDDEPVLICPNCKKQIFNEDTQFLSKAPGWMNRNFKISSYGFSDDEDKKILNIFGYTIFPVVDTAKLKIVKINCRFIFNTKTKNVYAMEPYNVDTNRRLFKETKRILNITHMGLSYEYLTDIQRKIINDSRILEYICENIPGLSDDNNGSFREIVSKFRYGYYSDEVRYYIQTLTDIYWITAKNRQRKKRLLQDIYNMQNNPDELNRIMIQKKCPQKKKLKKMCINNPFCIYAYRYLTLLGIKDYNIITDILSDDKIVMCLIKTYIHHLNTDSDSDNIEKFIKSFVVNKGEIETKKKLLDSSCRGIWEYYLPDTARLYEEVKLRAPDISINYTNMKDMHDELSRLLYKLERENKQIPYTKDKLSLNKQYGEYQFFLAPDTNSLIECGEAMGICVGGYSTVTLKGESVIVFMMKNKSFRVCIELTPTLNLLQAKSKFNNKVNGEDAFILKKWVEDNKICALFCKDYTHIKNGEIEDFKLESTFNHSITNMLSSNSNIEISQNYLIIDEKNNNYKGDNEFMQNNIMEELEWEFLEDWDRELPINDE